MPLKYWLQSRVKSTTPNKTIIIHIIYYYYYNLLIFIRDYCSIFFIVQGVLLFGVMYVATVSSLSINKLAPANDTTGVISCVTLLSPHFFSSALCKS